MKHTSGCLISNKLKPSIACVCGSISSKIISECYLSICRIAGFRTLAYTICKKYVVRLMWASRLTLTLWRGSSPCIVAIMMLTPSHCITRICLEFKPRLTSVYDSDLVLHLTTVCYHGIGWGHQHWTSDYSENCKKKYCIQS